jgi:dienelactone hydrolase
VTSLALALSVAIGCASALQVAPHGRAVPVLWAGLVPGPYQVGYRRLGASAAVVHVWYPASASGSPLCFGDYLEEPARLRAFLEQTGVPSRTIDSLFVSRLYAGSMSSPVNRPFPLVLVAQGNGQDAADQVVLSEYLASQGFVVASTPSPMLRTPLEREDQVGAFAESQADELAAAIKTVAAMVPLDTLQLGVVGHSFGARAALLLAMRDPRVRAVVSLDGGIGTATAVESFVRAPSFRANARLPALLHFYEDLDPFATPDFVLLRTLHTKDLVLVRTEGLHHVHFTTYGFASAVFPGLAVVTHATSTTPGGVREVARRTAAFLRRHLAGRRS